ncbi:unnamed protein product [Bubo scandiacus]
MEAPGCPAFPPPRRAGPPRGFPGLPPPSRSVHRDPPASAAAQPPPGPLSAGQGRAPVLGGRQPGPPRRGRPWEALPPGRGCRQREGVQRRVPGDTCSLPGPRESPGGVGVPTGSTPKQPTGTRGPRAPRAPGQEQEQEAEEQDDLQHIPAGGAGEGLPEDPLPRRLRPGAAGTTDGPDRGQGAGLVPEPTGQVAEAGTLRENPGGESCRGSCLPSPVPPTPPRAGGWSHCTQGPPFLLLLSHGPCGSIHPWEKHLPPPLHFGVIFGPFFQLQNNLWPSSGPGSPAGLLPPESIPSPCMSPYPHTHSNIAGFMGIPASPGPHPGINSLYSLHGLPASALGTHSFEPAAEHDYKSPTLVPLRMKSKEATSSLLNWAT